jgi:hypothetical protein
MYILMVCKLYSIAMSNKLLEKVEYLLDQSDNVYTMTLKVALLAKNKKTIEYLSSDSSKENIIIQAVNETFDLITSQGE